MSDVVESVPPVGSAGGSGGGSIPTTLADVTPDWLAEALGQPVIGASATVIAQGEGFMGHLARVVLIYGPGASPDAPATVIVKLPTQDPGGQFIGQMMRVWEREHRFYDEVAPQLQVRVPKAYVNRADLGAGSFALVLEDLAPMRTSDQVTGTTGDQARRVIDELATLHSPWWATKELDALTWMPDLRDPMVDAVVPMFTAGWPAFCDRYRGRLPERVFGWVEEFAAGIPEWMKGYQEEPCTLTHGDARLDNMFFGDDGSFALVDWQLSMRVPGTSDLVYFVTTNLTSELRRKHERELLERYRQQMLAAGATGRVLTEDGIIASYLDGVLFWCVSMASGVLSLDPGNERGAALLDALVQRLYQAADDLDCGQVLRG